MAAPRQTQVIEAVERCSALWIRAVSFLQAAKAKNGTFFDLTHPIPALDDESLTSLDTSLSGSLDLLGQAIPPEEAPLIPRRYIVDLHNSLQQLAEIINQFVTQWENLEANGGLQNVDMNNLSAQSANGSVNINISKALTGIRNRLDSVLDHHYRLAVVVRGKSYGGFSSAFRGLQRELARIRELDQTLREARETSASAADRIGGLAEDARRAKESIDSLRAEIATARDEGSNTLGAIKDLLSQSQSERKNILSINQEASQLATTVEMYKNTFANFQNQLNEYEKRIKEGYDRQDALLEWFDGQRDNIQDINSKSEDMLAGATTAGLTGKFEQIRNELSREVVKARWAFYGAIFLLALASVPLLLFIFQLGPLHTETLRQVEQILASKPALQILTEAIIRAILLLPGIWLVKFCAARHAQLFRLKEHYAYKHSVAASVDGFKKQAEPYKDEIAAATFFELTFNPANRMDTKVQEARAPNPIMEKFMKKFGLDWDGQAE